MEVVAAAFRLGRNELQHSCKSVSMRFSRRFVSTGRLAEIGKFEEPKSSGEVYQIGQCFMHRLFGFRGVVLASWRTKFYDSSQDTSKTSSIITPTVSDRVCYVALLDSGDLQNTADFWQDAAYFLAEEANQSQVGVRRINGLAYVEHSELLPYSTSEPTPIRHQLFNHFLAPFRNAQPANSNAGNGLKGKSANTNANAGASASAANGGFLEFRPTTMLRQFLEDSAGWLEPCTTVCETSENVRVSVTPFFLGEIDRSKQYCWSYSVRLENLTPEEPVRLLRRFWRVFSTSGTANTWKGDGVVGRRPELFTGRHIFQYSSTVALYTAGGHMWGTYHFERTNGEEFEVRIPTFYLETQEQRKRTQDAIQPLTEVNPPAANSDETRSDNAKARKRKSDVEKDANAVVRTDAKGSTEKGSKTSKSNASAKANVSVKTTSAQTQSSATVGSPPPDDAPSTPSSSSSASSPPADK